MTLVSIVVLDIDVLLFDPEAIFEFPEKEIVLPVNIFETLDILKRDLGEKGRAAQVVSYLLDKCSRIGDLVEGVSLSNSGKLRIDLSRPEESVIPFDLDLKNYSNHVLALAWKLNQEHNRVVFVSKNENLRTKSEIIGVKAVSYEGRRKDDSCLYSGIIKFDISTKDYRILRNKTYISPSDLSILGLGKVEFFPNQGLCLYNSKDSNENILGVYNQGLGKFEFIKEELGVWGIKPRNEEQSIAMQLLMNPKISIVSLSGKAGTGKTLLAIAVGLQQMMLNKIYSRMLVSRPILPMGRDMGFLPGDTQEKLAPWMQPIFDNLELLINGTNSKMDSKRDFFNELINKRLLIVEPLTYIRGRTIPNQFMIVDEAQNLTLHEMKTIVTRAGEGTKIVLTGDPNQIDNSEVNLSSNGMSMLVERFKNSHLAGHVRFSTVVRSDLAELAAIVL